MKQSKRICSVCGRDCNSLTGMFIDLTSGMKQCKEVQEIYKLFGKTKFYICFTCQLLSLGVRPKEKK